MQNKVIFLNGPPGCGKDTIGNILHKNNSAVLLKFAQPLKDALCGLLNINYEKLEEIKNYPVSIIDSDFTVRDLIIELAENIIKPNIARTWFSHQVAQNILNSHNEFRLFIITDAGFDYEVDYCIDFINKNSKDFNFEIWNIHRKNCNFNNDSRRYIERLHNNILFTKITNNTSLEELELYINHLNI